MEVTNRYNELGNEIMITLIGLDRSGSMNEDDKFNQAINGINICQKAIYADDSLFASSLIGYTVYGNKVELIKPLGTADETVDFNQYAPTNEGTAQYENRTRSGKYSLQAIREAQKAGKVVKGCLLIDVTDGKPTDSYNLLEAKKINEKCKEKGIITMALAIGDDCNIDLLKKYNDHVFKVTEPENIEKFFKEVVLETIKSVSQSITGDQFSNQYVSGTASVGDVTQEDLDEVKDVPPFIQLQ